jgi:hypothetical protein
MKSANGEKETDYDYNEAAAKTTHQKETEQ